MALDQNLEVQNTSGSGFPVSRWQDPNTSGNKPQLVVNQEIPLTRVEVGTADSQVTVAGTVMPMPGAITSGGAIWALIDVQGGTASTDGLRWTDGTALSPTSTFGHILYTGNYYWIRQNLSAFKMIRLTAASVTVNISPYKI